MSRSLKLSLAMIAAAAAVLVGLLALTNRDDGAAVPEAGGANAELLVRDDSPRLSDGDDVVFVEFLDFECEGCTAMYPVVEDLRERYGDRVTFVVRHMPLHGNSLNAAQAAEAAAEQDQFEAMYKRLFETSQQWGHQEASQRETFFGYAEDLGLDMGRFQAAYDDPVTIARIGQSMRDGQQLGVTGTPTFFIDGEMVQLTSVADLENGLNAALND